MKKVFNIFARAINCILKMDVSEREYAEILVSISGNSMDGNIMNGLPSQIMRSNGTWKEILPSVIDKQFCNELDRYYQKSRKKKENLVFLVYVLDKALKGLFDASVCIERDVEELKPLNTNVGNIRLALFPRVKCRWEHKSQGSCYRNNLENFMHNFFYCETGNIKDVEIHNYIVSKMFFRSLEAEKELTIAVSPVTSKDILVSESYKRNNKRYFHIIGLQEKEIIKCNVESAVAHAVEKKANILLFPEMLGSKDMISDILGTCDFRKVSSLVVWPSIWKKTKGDRNNTNTSLITLHKGKSVVEVCRQSKKDSFINYDDNTVEDLSSPKTWVVNIISCEGIGRIGILICKDFLIDKNRKLLCEILKTTLILVPSYSTGAHNFDILLPQFFERDCNIVWCNTCSAAMLKGAKIENFENIAAITSYTADKNQKGDYVHYYKGAACCDEKDCRNCLYVGRIPFAD